MCATRSQHLKSGARQWLPRRSLFTPHGASGTTPTPEGVPVKVLWWPLLTPRLQTLGCVSLMGETRGPVTDRGRARQWLRSQARAYPRPTSRLCGRPAPVSLSVGWGDRSTAGRRVGRGSARGSPGVGFPHGRGRGCPCLRRRTRCLIPVSPAPRPPPRHPGGTAEAHPDDLAGCGAPGPARPWECCQVPTCPPPPGSSVTTQRRGRSQAGPLDPWGQGRLHEHQPKLKCLFLLPCWLCSCPAPPPITPRLSLEGPLHPERTGGPGRPSRAQRSCQHPARPVQTYPPDTHIPRPRIGRGPPSGGASCHTLHVPKGDSLPFCNAVPMNFGIRVGPDVRPPSLTAWVHGFRWGGGEHSCVMVLPWAADTSARARFHKGP